MSFVPPATTSSAFYHPVHSSMYDPRLKNWSTWAAEAARGPALPETPAPPARPLDLFPDSDSSDEAPSFAPPRRMIMPGEHVAQNPTDPANALWNTPGQSAQGSEQPTMFAQPVSQWPADIVHQYNEIATNPTTFSLPNGHRQNSHRGPMPAHMMMPRGVHIDSSLGHQGHHHVPPPAHPMAMAPTPPDLVPVMESLALVPAVKPLPVFRPPIDLYRNNINPPARPPSAPPALAGPVPPHADQIPIAPISMTAPPPAPTKLSDSAPAPIPPNAFNLTQYMPYSAPAHAPQPPPTSSRAYMTAHVVGNHINAVPATTAAAAPRPVTPKIAPPVPQPPVPAERPHQQRRNSATIKKGILQETLYQEPPASSWHTTWFDNGPYPPVVPLSLHEPAPIKKGRKRGASVSAFQTPSSLVQPMHQPLHAYGAGSNVGISAQHTGTGDKRSGMFSPTDHLDSLLAGAGPASKQQIPQPPGTAPHPFFLESLTPTAPIKPTVGGGYPWYTPTATEAPHPAAYGGLFGEEPAPPQKPSKQKKGDDKENAQAHLAYAYAYHEMATAKTPTAPVKDMRRGAPAPGPLVDTTSLWTDQAAAESWYTTSVPTTSGGNKIKKTRPQPAPSHATTPAAQLLPTPILRGPNETAAFYGMAVKFADEPVTKKKGKR